DRRGLDRRYPPGSIGCLLLGRLRLLPDVLLDRTAAFSHVPRPPLTIDGQATPVGPRRPQGFDPHHDPQGACNAERALRTASPPSASRTPLGASCASLTRLYRPLNSGRVKPSR